RKPMLRTAAVAARLAPRVQGALPASAAAPEATSGAMASVWTPGPPPPIAVIARASARATRLVPEEPVGVPSKPMAAAAPPAAEGRPARRREATAARPPRARILEALALVDRQLLGAPVEPVALVASSLPTGPATSTRRAAPRAWPR